MKQKTRQKKEVAGFSTRKKPFKLSTAISTTKPTEKRLMYIEFLRQSMQGRGINKIWKRWSSGSLSLGSLRCGWLDCQLAQSTAGLPGVLDSKQCLSNKLYHQSPLLRYRPHRPGHAQIHYPCQSWRTTKPFPVIWATRLPTMVQFLQHFRSDEQRDKLNKLLNEIKAAHDNGTIHLINSR